MFEIILDDEKIDDKLLERFYTVTQSVMDELTISYIFGSSNSCQLFVQNISKIGKSCSSCSVPQVFDLFHLNKGRRDGHESSCKFCIRRKKKDARRRKEKLRMKKKKALRTTDVREFDLIHSFDGKDASHSINGLVDMLVR